LSGYAQVRRTHDDCPREGDGGCLGAVTEFKPTAVAPEDVCELYECHFGGSQRWSSSPRMSPHGSTRQRLTQASQEKRVTVPWTSGCGVAGAWVLARGPNA